MNNRSKVPSNPATNITHNVNLSFEIGTTHMNPTENNRTTIEDVNDPKNSSEHNDTYETDHENINNGALARAGSDEGSGKPNGISHGLTHELRSGCPGNRMSHLGNPHGIRPDNDCIVGTQEHVSTDTTLGVEANGQHVKTNGKPKGISHATRMPIADPTLVPKIYSGVKRKGDSSDLQGGNLTRTRPDNTIVASMQENMSVNTWEEEAIGQHVKTNGKPQGISHSTRMPIVDSTPVEQIHSNVKRQIEKRKLDHVDTDEKLFLLMQESYPESYNDYGYVNQFEKIAISILKTGIVPKIDKRKINQYDNIITRINNYRSQHDVPVIPESLLEIKEQPVLKPVYTVRFAYCDDIDSYLDGIRLMGVEVQVINMIRTGVIPEMSEENKSKLMSDLDEINDTRQEASCPALDINKSLYDHFHDDDEILRQYALRSEQSRHNGSESDESSKDPSTDSDVDSIDDLFGDSSDPDPFYEGSIAARSYRRALARRDEPRSNPPGSHVDIDDDDVGDRSDPPHTNTIAPTSNDVSMEDMNSETVSSNASLENVTQETSLIDLTEGDQNNDCEMVECDTSASMAIAQVPSISKSIVKFIKELYAITKCPLTLEVIKNPYMGTDKTCYEREAVRQWLSAKAVSPTSRVPMEMHCLTPDYTMSRIVQAFEQAHLTEDVIEDLFKSLSAPPASMSVELPTIETVNPQGTSSENVRETKTERMKRKKARLKANQVAKKAALKKLNIHKDYLKEMRIYEDSNLMREMPPKPSYSLMHSLKDGFSILMYSGTHRAKLSGDMCMHKYNAVRIILPEWMAIIWHEALYHAGAKSREGLQDMRLFSYIWPEVIGNRRNRTKGSTDGVSREQGDKVYREDITNVICNQFYEENPRCDYCSKEIEILDLSGVSRHSYNPGDRIIGCLEELGWVVIRGIRVQDDTYESIDTIANSGYHGRVTKTPYWTSIEERNNKRVMKYKHSSTPHVNWEKDAHCSNFLGDIKTKLLDNILKGGNYIIGKFNLLKNNGVVPTDQQAHTDYPPRQVK